MTRASPSGRATRASHQAPAGLDHSAGIPDATGWQLAAILDDSRWAVLGRCQDYRDLGAVLRDRRDWFEAKCKRLEAEVTEAGREMAEIAVVVRYLSEMEKANAEA